MFDFPNSSAMDATASSGGPGTFLFEILTGQPQQIQQHSESLLQKATQFISLMDEFTKASEQLGKVWSGSASESALKKITSSLQSFEKIIQVIQNGAKLLGISSTLVQSAQTAYKSVVAAVNPTVAGLMSNWWTYGAAVALSTSVSASLRAFITAIQGLLQTLGVARLGQEIMALATIVTEIEQLFNGGSAGSSSGVGPTNQTVGSTPIGMPQMPNPVASQSGLQAIQGGITNYSPPALTGYNQPAPGTGAGAALGQLNGYGVPGASAAYNGGGYPPANNYPNGGYPPANNYPGNYPGGSNPGNWTDPGYMPPQGNYPQGNYPGGGVPSIDPNNSWIATDPSQTAASTPAAPPATPPAAGTGQDITIGTNDHGIETSVSVPVGTAAHVDLDITADGQHMTEHFDVGADGSVKVS